MPWAAREWQLGLRLLGGGVFTSKDAPHLGLISHRRSFAGVPIVRTVVMDSTSSRRFAIGGMARATGGLAVHVSTTATATATAIIATAAAVSVVAARGVAVDAARTVVIARLTTSVVTVAIVVAVGRATVAIRIVAAAPVATATSTAAVVVAVVASLGRPTDLLWRSVSNHALTKRDR